MAKREFLQLAQNFNPDKHSLAGWCMSEKLDGMRAFWDGGHTRGMKASYVPFANTEKDHRLKEEPVSTGLWSRYGKVIHAPGWWLDHLPEVPLDGELYMGRGLFQTLMSTCRRYDFSGEWIDVRFVVFDTPPLDQVFSDGKINNTNFKKVFSGVRELFLGCPTVDSRKVFSSRIAWLRKHKIENAHVEIHDQTFLPVSTNRAYEQMQEKLFEVQEAGGEGLIIKNPQDLWLPERVWNVLKVKPWSDAEGEVVGYNWGKEGVGDKLVGLMGSLILRTKAGEFKLSGFTDLEREMEFVEGGSAYDVGCKFPDGQEVAPNIHNPRFPRGSLVTFKYRELTDDGLPKEARYYRPAAV